MPRTYDNGSDIMGIDFENAHDFEIPLRKESDTQIGFTIVDARNIFNQN
jgi:hypothetical protein